MASSSQHTCVYVGNIPYDATEEQLVQICEEIGRVVSFRLVLDRETGKSKGHGFCVYKDEETALSAIRNLQGYEINGRQLRVNFAHNDKNADRNREQGRGGPIHRQPLGCELAESAASVMAKHLGGAQTCVHGQEPAVSNPLTFYLAKMSKDQLHEVMAEMKALATQDIDMARQLLQTNPQQSKSLFQAQIMLGMIKPEDLPQVLLPSSSGLQSQVSGIPKILPPNVPSQAVTQVQPVLTATGTWQQSIRPQQPSSQFSPEIETTLLQQVMSLTPEQMGSLSAEQRQQVMQLQQMLHVQPQQPLSQFSPEMERNLFQQVMGRTPEQMGSLSAEQRQQVMLLQKMLRG